MSATRLERHFYQQDTIEVARALLGCLLVHELGKGSNKIRLSGLITETEAYLGVNDPAAHTFSGRRTDRVQSMYKDGGHAYVYLIYGLHHCVNVVTMAEGVPEAVLLRAILPTEGIDEMCRLRSRARKPGARTKAKAGALTNALTNALTDGNTNGKTGFMTTAVTHAELIQLANGPGKLCQAMAITKACDGCDLTSSNLYIQPRAEVIAEDRITESGRVGVEYAGDAAFWPLRFRYTPDNSDTRQRM